jgi:hypothetical protein
MTAWLTALLASIIEPILDRRLQRLESWAFDQSRRLQAYERFDREANELIEAAQNATTTEEVRAHLRRLRETRAKINV